MAATWSEDDASSDEESSSDESSSEEELVSNFVAFMASHSTLEDVNQDSLDKEIDQSHQECSNDNPSYIDLWLRLLREKNAIEKKLCEVEGILLEKDRIISNMNLESSSVAVVEEKLIEASLPTSEAIIEEKAPKKRRSKKKNKLKNKKMHPRNRAIGPNSMHAKAFEYGKHDNLSKHAKNIRKVKNAYPTKFDHACVANNVEKKSINDIIVNQVVEELYSRFNIVVKENLDDVSVVHPRQNLSRVSALTISIIQERGIDLDSCIGSYVYDVLKSRNWISWVNMLGVSNETIVREFYNAYKSGSTVTSATLSIRKVVFRVCPRKVNEFLNLSDDIESDFLDD
ncbi:hypothetical protein LWI29_033949 [Acer saccharum]|uniref:Uncharacterized protein n=1 Tax=Acer saccharum TaxID=4024 RepID=A0AA39TBM9_ACESA|nr:hypothetical protein LWI29_033949 [Acer saccharum]